MRTISIGLVLVLVPLSAFAEKAETSQEGTIRIELTSDGATIELDGTGSHRVNIQPLPIKAAPESGLLPQGQPNSNSMLVLVIPSKKGSATGYLHVGLFDPEKITLNRVKRHGKVTTKGQFTDQFSLIWYQRTGKPVEAGTSVEIRGSIVWQRTVVTETRVYGKYTLKEKDSNRTFVLGPTE